MMSHLMDFASHGLVPIVYRRAVAHWLGKCIVNVKCASTTQIGKDRLDGSRREFVDSFLSRNAHAGRVMRSKE